MISKKELYESIEMKRMTLPTDGWLNSILNYSEDYHETIFTDTYHQMNLSLTFSMSSVVPSKIVTSELVDERKRELVEGIHNKMFGNLLHRLRSLNSAIHFGDRKTASIICKSILEDLEK